MLAVFTDASVENSRRNRVSLGFVVVENGKVLERVSKYFETTDIKSSEAEYMALIHAMRWVLNNTQPQKVYFFTDFIDIPKRLEKEQSTWDENVWKVATLIDNLVQKGFEPIIRWICRDYNIGHKSARRGLEYERA